MSGEYVKGECPALFIVHPRLIRQLTLFCIGTPTSSMCGWPRMTLKLASMTVPVMVHGTCTAIESVSCPHELLT